MTITIAVAGRIATATATTQVVAGNTYPVTLSLDSEWTGSLYLRVRFGGLYYDIPFASSDTSVDVQMPVGYPEVGIGVFSEALEICTNEARVRLLRSILEAGEQVVEFDSDLYDQWAGEVTTLLTDDAFDAESTKPVRNSVITAWKNQVEGGAMTVAGAKTFTSPVTVANPTASGHAVNVGTLEARLIDGSVTKVGTADVGSDAKPIKLVGGVPTAVGADLAVDSAVVHTSGNESIAGEKSFEGSYTNVYKLRSVDPAAYGATQNKCAVTLRAKLEAGTMVDYVSAFLWQTLSGSGMGNSLAVHVKSLDGTVDKSMGFKVVDADGYSTRVSVPSHLPVDGSGNHIAPANEEVINSAMLAVDPRIVHTTGNETIAGSKTLSGTTKLLNSAVEMQSPGLDQTSPPSYTSRTICELKTKSDLSQSLVREEALLATGGNSYSLVVHARDSEGADVNANLILTAYRDGTCALKLKKPNGTYVDIVPKG